MQKSAVLLALLSCVAASADEVYLKGGGRVSGRIVQRTATSVEIDVGAGTVKVAAKQVERIVEGRSALDVYYERAGALDAKDREGWAALGRWASDQGLSAQSREAYHRVLAVDPTDPEANQALGNVRVNGQWMTEEAGNRARGYVQFEGEWMTPAERQAIESQRAGGRGPGQGRRGGAAGRGRGGPAALVGMGAGARDLADPAADPTEASAATGPSAAAQVPVRRRLVSPRARRAILHRRWIGLAVAGLAPVVASAQTVDEIVAKHLEARGGASRIAAIESLRMTAKARAQGGREAVVVREVKRPDRFRLEFTSQGVTGVYAYDGERSWCVSPFDGDLEPEPMPTESARSAIEGDEIGGPLADWKAKGHLVELVGRESLEGREAWKLKVTLSDSDARYLYLDARSFLQLRTEATRTVAGRPIEVEATYGDYQETAGVLFPREIAIGVKGRPPRLRIMVQSVEVNPVLDDARFRMPGASR
jgi:hypothetical protein